MTAEVSARFERQHVTGEGISGGYAEWHEYVATFTDGHLVSIQPMVGR